MLYVFCCILNTHAFNLVEKSQFSFLLFEYLHTNPVSCRWQIHKALLATELPLLFLNEHAPDSFYSVLARSHISGFATFQMFAFSLSSSVPQLIAAA